MLGAAWRVEKIARLCFYVGMLLRDVKKEKNDEMIERGKKRDRQTDRDYTLALDPIHPKLLDCILISKIDNKLHVLVYIKLIYAHIYIYKHANTTTNLAPWRSGKHRFLVLHVWLKR